MSEMTITTSQGSYPVDLAPGAVPNLLSRASVVLMDRNVLASDRLASADAPLIVVEGSEDTKTLLGCESLLVEMNRLGVRRGDLLVAVGGGAVQDAATFLASFYMRGIPWGYVPSTAMAMADSCIGGKSSINIGGIKNLGGNIYPPVGVAIDPALAQSLPLAARVSGLAEAVKICFAAGPSAFTGYLDRAVTPEDFGPSPRTAELLGHVLRSKKWFIEIDEFDRAERQLLNFGHTFAHALESATAFAVQHGVAVGIGLLAALRHPAAQLGPTAERLDLYCRELLAPIASHLAELRQLIDWDAFDRAVLSDKKGTRDSLRLVLPADTGVQLIAIPRSDVALAAIRGAMASALEAVGA